MLRTKYTAFILTITVLCQIFIFIACSKKGNYRDDIPCRDVSEAFIQSQSGSVEYSQYSREELSFFLDIPEYVTDLSAIYSTDVNDINETGIFRCTDETSAKEFFGTVSAYLEEQRVTQKAFIESYAPREVPKLEGAEVRRYGNYVVYTILSAEDKKAVWELTDKKIRG